MEKMANVDLKFLRNVAEYFCIQGLVKIVDEEIEKTEKGEAKRLAQFSSLINSQKGMENSAWLICFVCLFYFFNYPKHI